ncbi:MAG: ORF6N domain-containing protein [Betaproteobacteria bacterium]
MSRKPHFHVVHSSVQALRWYYRTNGGSVVKEAPYNQQLEPLILAIRGHRVVLDADLARLYGVGTKRFNEAFKRNRRRFPGDFAFQITAAELDNLRSQFATSSSHGGRRYLPWAFTEHGALMAASILRSERAVQMSVFVVRAFVRLREQVAANSAILKRLAEIDATLLEHNAALRDLYQKLLPLLQPLADPPKRRIGFHSDSD